MVRAYSELVSFNEETLKKDRPDHRQTPFFRVGAYYVSTLFSARGQYLIGLTILPGCFRKRVPQIRTSEASVFKLICAMGLDRAGIGKVMTSFFSATSSAGSSVWSRLKCERFFSGAAGPAELETKGRNTSHKPRKDQISIIDVETWNPWIPSVVCDTISNSRGRITFPRLSIMSVKTCALQV